MEEKKKRKKYDVEISKVESNKKKKIEENLLVESFGNTVSKGNSLNIDKFDWWIEDVHGQPMIVTKSSSEHKEYDEYGNFRILKMSGTSYF